MARQKRIESSDGIYHVINRGNYRKYIFETEGARDSFENTLLEACERMGWHLDAYTILSNHFHLCVETPQGNLSEGMQWLQGTFGTRFNRLRRENGHLFQGRFKSLIVEPGPHLLRLVEYIHLNALRAGLETKAELGKYRWSSLYHFPKRKSRTPYLDANWLDYTDEADDSAGGWKRYLNLLRMRAEDDPAEVAKLEKQMNRGWCIGSMAFKKALVGEYLEEGGILRLEEEELQELNRLQWEELLEKSLRALGKTEGDVDKERKGAQWKLAVASRLKRRSAVSNKWVSEKLKMGNPKAMSSICGKYQREVEDKCPFAKQLKNMEM